MKFREATFRACHGATSGGHSTTIQRASGGRTFAFTYPRPRAPGGPDFLVEYRTAPGEPWIAMPEVNHGNMMYDWTPWRSGDAFTVEEVLATDWTDCGGHCRTPCINVGERCNNQ